MMQFTIYPDAGDVGDKLADDPDYAAQVMDSFARGLSDTGKNELIDALSEIEVEMLQKLRNIFDKAFDTRNPGQGTVAAATSPSPVVNALLEWAVQKWRDEVANRPLKNMHRRSLDTTWRQVIRKFGGDPDALVGPSHDDLVAKVATDEASDGMVLNIPFNDMIQLFTDAMRTAYEIRAGRRLNQQTGKQQWETCLISDLEKGMHRAMVRGDMVAAANYALFIHVRRWGKI